MEREHPPLLTSILSIFKGEWKDIFAILAYAIGVGICSLTIPVAVQALVNSVAIGTLMQPILVLTGLVAGVLLFSGILRVLQLFVAEVMQRRIVVRFALFLAQKLPHVIVDKFHREFGPEYILRFMEVFAIQKVVALLLLDGIAVFFQVIIGLILVSFYHPFFLAFALLVLLSVVIVVFLMGIGGVKSSIKESTAKYDVLAWLQDLASVPTIFKSHAGEQYAMTRSDELVQRYLVFRRKHFSVLLRQNIGALLIQTFANAALLFLGGVLVMRGELTLGQLVSAELIFSLVLISVTKTGKHLEKFYDLCASVNKLEALNYLPYESFSDVPGKSSVFEENSRGRGAKLQVNSLVAYSADTAATPTLNNLSLEMAPGAMLAIWGPNGAGKSYLSNILYRLASPTSGWVEIDDCNIAAISFKDLRSQVFLTKDIELFHGTILDNLIAGKVIDQVRIRSVLRDLGLLKAIESLPNGLTTIVRGSWGPLSRGLSLKLMIARAILNEPRLLIVDGTLDSIDEESVPQTLTALRNNLPKSTILVLTHERHLLQHFEAKMLLADGDLKSMDNGG